MSWWIVLAGSVTMLLLLLALGVPVFVAFLVLNVVAVAILFGPAGFGMFANSIYATGTNEALTAVPMFILMGELLFRSGAMEVVFDSMDRLIGRIRGRQYVLCILLSAMLGALSGAAIAVAGLLGRSLLPTMLKRGYNARLAVGTILGGASLDPIIPPSVLAIIVATLAQISTGKLLVAGVLPGILLTGMFLAYVFVRLRIDPALAPDVAADIVQQRTIASALIALLRMLPCALIFFLVMGLVMLGIATPTEAAGTGVFGAIVLASFYGRLSVPLLKETIFASVRVASLLLVVMVCAVMFSQILSFTGAARELGIIVANLSLPPPLMLFSLLALPFVLFMFLDPVALMMVLIPIYQPLLAIYSFDEIWFWMLFLIVATVGGISPPFGYTLFALKSAAADLPMSEIYAAAWPFVWIMTLGMLLMIAFPWIITVLPGAMGSRS